MSEKKPLGLLIVHGFTGSLDTVRALVPVAERLGLPWRMPVLRGHGTRYEDLVGVRWRDWVADAEAALAELRTECDKVVVAGLSMGGLVALNLAMAHEKDLEALVLITPALRFSDPLTPLTPLLKLLFKFWDAPTSFADAELAKGATNYPRFPTATFSQLLDFACETERRLAEVRVPVQVLYSKQDKTVHPIVVKLIEDKLGSKDIEVVRFERSGHEMLQDCEADAVVAAIEGYLERHAERLAHPTAS